MRQEKETGQALVEFAIVAPVILLIMFGILSFGLMFTWMNMINNAAREGARAGAVGATNGTIIAIVQTDASLVPGGINTSNITIYAVDANGNQLGQDVRVQGGALTVTVTYLANIVPIPGILLSTRLLTAQSTFRMETSSP